MAQQPVNAPPISLKDLPYVVGYLALIACALYGIYNIGNLIPLHPPV